MSWSGQHTQKTGVAIAGAYLKLWESPDVQREYIQQHMTQGQVYSHWGPVNDEVNLEKSQIESMLANRTVYHADMSRSDQQQHKQTSSPAAQGTSQGGTKAENVCEGASGSAKVQSDSSAHAEHSSAKPLSDVATSLQVWQKTLQCPGVELQAAGMLQQERTAAAKEHNRQVLATAGLEALGRQESVDGDGGKEGGARKGGKRQRSGGTVKKMLEKVMRKQVRS